MALVHSKGAGSSTALHAGTSEFEILKSSHRFLREDDEVEERQLSWDERLAKKYYSSLYREYAVCDLKHYKSGNFALRWRTEAEVLSGAGETTCGNTRCPLHREHPEEGSDIRPSFSTLELPFSYVEQGESKFALVKVVLCPKCVKKLMYKRNKEKEEASRREERASGSGHGNIHREQDDERRTKQKSPKRRPRTHYHDGVREEDDESAQGSRSRRHSRSRSPYRRRDRRRDDHASP
ncbi:folate-sensitive fragile site protein Fra10Ac1-domain-containing protein [Trametes meyenii]|nr:folate-sensitive fragile site protein Fra10Ac1-domain-containing protein [Trametes meyenii]